MKNLIKYLYNKLFPKHSLLENKNDPVDIKNLPEPIQNIHYSKCKEYLTDGTLTLIAEGLSAEYLHNIVFTLDNKPILISPAEIERAKILAIEDVLSTIENWSSRLEKKESFNPDDII